MVAHIYRKGEDGAWMFEALGDEDPVVAFASVGVSVPLAEIYQFVELKA